MTRLVIGVGGSDAATEAALGARRVDADLDIAMIVADSYLNYSICGLPFLVSGEVDDHLRLAHRTSEDVTERHRGLSQPARAIDRRGTRGGRGRHEWPGRRVGRV